MLETDIPQYASTIAATGRKLKILIKVISAFAPLKPNMTSLSSQIQTNRSNEESCLLYMESGPKGK